MTRGLPPDAAVFRPAGTFVPAAVVSALSLPVWLVFVGTVLLSVVLGWCSRREDAVVRNRDGRRTAAKRPLGGPR